MKNQMNVLKSNDLSNLPSLLLILLISSSLISCSDSSNAPSSDPVDNGAGNTIDGSTTPNILLIIADDQGLDASAQYSYSSDLATTPILNQLATDGLIFDNAWATPACTTTRGTMMTGMHGINSGVSFLPAEMDATLQTLPKYLKSINSNYQTAVIGKWHLAGGQPELTHPNDSGVDYYAGNLAGPIADYNDWDLTINGVTTNSTQYHSSKITDLAIDWLNTQNQQDTPWFMWLAYVAPHSPFHLPPAELHTQTGLTGTAAHITANKRDYYNAAIEAMDSEIGRLLASMSVADRENTIIIYIGDNGTPAGVIDRNVFARTHSKGTLYEGGIRIPMFVTGNGVSRAGEREAALVNTSDFYATFGELIGASTSSFEDSFSFSGLLVSKSAPSRQYNYAEFMSTDVTGWVTRDADYKYIQLVDGTTELYKVSADLGETNDLLLTNDDVDSIVQQLSAYGRMIRGELSITALDITNINLSNRSANCADYIQSYRSTVTDVNQGTMFNGALTITSGNGKCIFQTNNIPNHDFNDGSVTFASNVSEQNNTLEISSAPLEAASNTELTLSYDNAVLLNGVKIDLLAAACFNVGNEKIGCNDISQPWRFDPAFINSSFRIDTHNAHTQPNGAYHYHGNPNALFATSPPTTASPLIGFAADGFPIYGPYIDDNGTIRKATSGYQLRTGARPSGTANPSGDYDGTYRDDYEHISSSGDLDECNGMMAGGVYAYYITDSFPYILNCFKGTPDSSFRK